MLSLKLTHLVVIGRLERKADRSELTGNEDAACFYPLGANAGRDSHPLFTQTGYIAHRNLFVDS